MYGNTSIINIRLLFCILFFIELKCLLWYSSNIYFFVLFLLLVFSFFKFFSNVLHFKDFFFEAVQFNYTISSLSVFNKIQYSLKTQWVHYNILFKFYVINYKHLLLRKLKVYVTSLEYFFMYLKSCFLSV